MVRDKKKRTVHSKSKKMSKKDIFDLIHMSVKNGGTPYDIQKKIKIKKGHLSYYVSEMKRKGIISNIGYGVWENDRDVKESDFKKKSKKVSIGTKGETNIHALNINIPVLSGKLNLVKDFNGYAQKRFNNWIPEYKKIIVPIGFTLKNNNNKSVDVQIWSRRIVKIDEIQNVVLRTIIFTQNLLKKHVNLDIYGAQVKTIHAIVRENDLEKVMNKSVKITVPLNRKTAKILDNDEPKDALVWTDASPFRGLESNDVAYVKNYMLMPEQVKRNAEMIELQNQAINEVKGLLGGLGQQQVMISNAIMLQTKLMQQMTKLLEKIK